MVFHWSLSDSKSSQVSKTLLSILTVFNNVVVWMVSTRLPTSKSSSPFSNPLLTIPNAPITIGIIVTCMFHSFLNSLARSRYLSFFSHSFSFILWSTGTVKSTILQVLFFKIIIIIITITACPVIWFYVSLINCNNFQADLFHQLLILVKVLTIQTIGVLGVMAKKCILHSSKLQNCSPSTG